MIVSLQIIVTNKAISHQTTIPNYHIYLLKFHLKYIIVQVWQKFLDYYLNNESYKKIEQNIRDLQQLKVLKMRYNLYEIQKNRKTILKFLFTLLS